MVEEDKVPTVDDIFNIIKKWAKGDDIFVKELDHPETVRIMKILIGDKMQGTVYIPVKARHSIIISHNLTLPKELVEGIEELSNEEFSDLWYNLFSGLIQLGVDFDSQKNKKQIQSIQLNYEFAREEIFISHTTVSKTLFMEKMGLIRKSVLFTVHTFMYYSGRYDVFLGLDIGE